MSAPVVEAGQHDIGAVDLIAGRAEILADGANVGAAGHAVLHEPGGLRLVGISAGAGMDAQLSLERRADRSGRGELDQAAGEDRRLRPGGQPDGQPPGGEVINAGTPAVGCGNAVADETLIEWQVRERPVLRKPVGMLIRKCCAVISFCASASLISRLQGWTWPHRVVSVFSGAVRAATVIGFEVMVSSRGRRCRCRRAIRSARGRECHDAAAEGRGTRRSWRWARPGSGRGGGHGGRPGSSRRGAGRR